MSPSSPSPLREKGARLPSTSKAPTEYAPGADPGDETESQSADGTVLPDDQTAKIPAAVQASLMAVKKSEKSCSASSPHELFTMCGRFDTSGLLPCESVGARSHQPESSRDCAPSAWQQPFVAIHF